MHFTPVPALRSCDPVFSQFLSILSLQPDLVSIKLYDLIATAVYGSASHPLAGYAHSLASPYRYYVLSFSSFLYLYLYSSSHKLAQGNNTIGLI